MSSLLQQTRVGASLINGLGFSSSLGDSLADLCVLSLRMQVKVLFCKVRDGNFSEVGRFSELDWFASLSLQFTCKTRLCDNCDTEAPETSSEDLKTNNKNTQTPNQKTHL